jgi:serine/threonine-protein kinase
MEKVKIQGQLSEAECLKYIRQIGSALEAVHQAGMVHRDAHPGNIMIQPNGNAILIDFGIAKEIIPASSSSTDYAANPSFAPYEQIYKGSKANRQPSVDIYALAASFYYAVTGEKPTPSMERRLDNRPLKSPKEINRNLSEHLNTAIILGMALEKGDRPQSMSDWLQKLELPPPAVEPKYRQEKVNPPQAIKTFQVPGEKKQRKVYLVPFIGVCFFYVGIGCILGVNSAPWQGVAVAMAVAVTVPLPVAMAMNVPVGASLTVTMGVSLAVAVAVAVAVATASSISMAPAAGVAISMAIASAWAVPGAVAGAWLLWETSIFDRWKNTAWFDSVKMLIFLFLSGVVSVIALGILSRSILYGIVTGVGGIVILFCQAFAASNLYYGNKKINFFNSFLILSSTNLGGLGSGWLLGFLLHSKG